MKNILLATTALVMVAGVASAEITITGSATAGLAREGTGPTKAVTAVAAHADWTTAANAHQAAVAALNTGISDLAADTTAAAAASQVTANKTLAKTVAAKLALLELQNDMGRAAVVSAAATNATSADMDTYMEVALTAGASVETDSGLGISTAMSIDAGTGYDFADDDGFDSAKSGSAGGRGGNVGLDHVTLSGGFGSLKMSKNNIAHLVDGDDDAAGDLKFSGAMGNTSYNIVADVAKDGKGGTAADKVDTAWSADVSTTMGGVALRVAMDEESGYAVSASMAVGGGLTVSVDSKKEAAEADKSAGVANNGIDLTYTNGAISVGADYDSVNDGDRYGYNVAYTTGNSMKITYKSDEDNDWTATVSMPLGGGVTAAGGVNYTQDAYLGVSFSF